ncbi:MAG: response regulator transcription factor [Betaproteobacteria bacterium]|nr:response regulator transcription factor [Betaproteobacteria bacterium]
MRVALLEDDPNQSELLARWLEMAGHRCHAFDKGAELLRELEHETYDALILDWGVPDISGVDVLRRLRQKLRHHTPVIFVTARQQEEDIVSTLKQGADDYMVKPVRRHEFLARVEAVARRTRAVTPENSSFEAENFKVDMQTRTLSKDDKPLELTTKDFELATLFLRNIGRLMSRGHIREMVWGLDANVTSRTLDTHVSRVRNKLGLTPETGWRLAAVYRYGYRLEQLTKPRLNIPEGE